MLNKHEKKRILAHVITNSCHCNYCELKNLFCDEKTQINKNKNNDNFHCFIKWFEYIKKRL